MTHGRDPCLTRYVDALARALSALCLAILVPFTFWALVEGPSARPASVDAARDGSGMAAGKSAGHPVSLPAGLHHEATEAPRAKIGPAQVEGGDRAPAMALDRRLDRDRFGARSVVVAGFFPPTAAALLPFGSRAPPAAA